MAFQRYFSSGEVGGIGAVTDRLAEVLKEHFGYEQFRNSQRELIEADMKGEDIIAGLATSRGKSLCFQLPSFFHPDEVRIIISPLVALMADQVRGLEEKGIGVSVFNSFQTKEEAAAQRGRVASGKSRIIYVSPERAATKGFLNWACTLKVNRMIVDEGHCASTWGHDFRPSYQQIPYIREVLGNPPISVFSATLPSRVREDVRQMLNVQSPYEIYTSPVRENLNFSVLSFKNFGEKVERLFSLLNQYGENQEPTVVYFSRIKTAKELQDIAAKKGISVNLYHGQMNREERDESQSGFMRNEPAILFATNAFGMGVDKPDIRHVIHFDIPSSLEALVQEGGRAGRDAQEATAQLFFCPLDILEQLDRLEAANPDEAIIHRVYKNVVAGFKPDQMKMDFPTRNFNRESFEKYYMDNGGPTLANTALSALGILEEFGFIKGSTRTITLLLPPQRDESDQILPPIRESQLSNKKKGDALRLGELIQYVYTPHDERSSLLELYFASDDTNQEIDPLVEMTHFDDLMGELCKFLLTEDCLSSKFSKRMEDPEFFEGNKDSEILHLTSDQVKSILKLTERRGWIKRSRIGTKSVLTLSHSFFIDNQIPEPSTKDIQDVKQLESLFHREGVLDLVSEPLKAWFEKESSHLTSTAMWTIMADRFLTQEFNIYGEVITGKKLVEMYYKKLSTLEAWYVFDFIKRLFPELVNSLMPTKELVTAERETKATQREMRNIATAKKNDED